MYSSNVQHGVNGMITDANDRLKRSAAACGEEVVLPIMPVTVAYISVGTGNCGQRSTLGGLVIHRNSAERHTVKAHSDLLGQWPTLATTP